MHLEKNRFFTVLLNQNRHTFCASRYIQVIVVFLKIINVTIILLTTYLIHKLTEVTKHKRRKFQ